MKYHTIHPVTCKSPRGFTLTELLVVILIIAALAALSITGIQKMRSSADKVTSIRNLSQLQIANIAYAGDHHGNFVAIRTNDEDGNLAAYWFQNDAYLTNLLGYVPETTIKKQGRFPSSLLDPKVYRARKDEYDRVFASYGLNDTGLPLGNTPNLNSFHSTNQMPDPSRSMAFSSAIDYRVTYNSRFNWKLENQLDSRKAPGSVGAMAYRHGNKALVVYFDGHVGEVTQGDIKTIDTTRGGKNSAFWKPTAQ